MPKQFLDFFSSGETLQQQTYARMKRFISPENILVATNADYESIVKDQLPEVSTGSSWRRKAMCSLCAIRDSSALLRKYIARVQLEQGDEFV